ncbi:hypothetical protein AB0O34_35005 [Sphaerisporangium sp. NPDC088356]|uniref:hypothetical protein n=1 Tax=Sphaerisporangium sp. NPDC088356 TaxID=3154871 RepID=UPI00344659B2
MLRRTSRVRHGGEAAPALDFDRPHERRPTRPPRHDPDATQHLENLRAALGQASPGLFVKLERPTGCPPRLRITVPELGELSETIHHLPGQGSEDAGYYAWAWGEVVGPVLRRGETAIAVLRFLAARGRHA